MNNHKSSPFLHDTEVYKVVIGISPFVSIPEGRKETPAAYLIVNKNNNIVEGEHRVLGMAIRMANEMQEIFDETDDNKDEQVDALPNVTNQS